jgi:hypothetical protein
MLQSACAANRAEGVKDRDNHGCENRNVFLAAAIDETSGFCGIALPAAEIHRAGTGGAGRGPSACLQQQRQPDQSGSPAYSIPEPSIAQ